MLSTTNFSGRIAARGRRDPGAQHQGREDTNETTTYAVNTATIPGQHGGGEHWGCGLGNYRLW